MVVLNILQQPSYKTENQQPKQSETLAVASISSEPSI